MSSSSPKYTTAGGLPLVSAVAPQVIVRGGTLSSSQENLIKQHEHDANVRRDAEDQRAQIAATQQGPGSMASMRSRKLITQDSPRLVLYYKKFDQFCLSEITMVARQDGPGMESMFTLVCTKCCFERGIPQGQAQLQIRESHRKFSIDDTKRGPRRVEFAGRAQIVQQCGTVTVEDVVRCPTNCGWRVRIIDSKVEEV